MIDEPIHCRAQLEDDCYDGSPMSRQLGEPGPMSADGTYKHDGPYAGTIVCDACYVRLMPLTPSGQGLHTELHPAINAYHAEHPRERYPLER
jgi:hypothetical protein